MVVAIVSLCTTIMLMIVLRFTTKMESIEFLTDRELTKLIGNIDLDEMYKVDGILEGFNDIPLALGSENDNILLHIVNLEDKRKISITILFILLLISITNIFKRHLCLLFYCKVWNQQLNLDLVKPK